MLCKKPFYKGGNAFGCSQCLPCRVKRRTEKTNRAILEALKQTQHSFITTTYDDNSVPKTSSGLPTLYRKDFTNFIKRLARKTERRIRYFGVGEYGEQTFRPHYHAIIFGVGPCHYFPGTSEQEKFARVKCTCPNCDLIRKTWQTPQKDGRTILGRTDCGSLTRDSAQYVAGYVTKKLTQPDNDKNREWRKANWMLLEDRVPEFPLYSLKPGIGAAAMENVAEILTTEHGCNELIESGDVPRRLNMGRKPLILDRYLRRKLREQLGFKEIGGQPGWQIEAQKEMRILLQAHSDREITAKEMQSLWQKKLHETQQKILNLESRTKVFSKKGTI